MIKDNWTLNNYQMQAREFAIYPEDMQIMYPALGLAGEAGEVADKVKKIYRDGRDDARFHADIAKEIGDVLWYCATLADDLGIDLQQDCGDEHVQVAISQGCAYSVTETIGDQFGIDETRGIHEDEGRGSGHGKQSAALQSGRD